MADYFTEFSTLLPMSFDQAQELYLHLEQLEDNGEDCWMPEHAKPEVNGLWLAGQYGIEDAVLNAIAEWLQDNIPDFGFHEISFAHYCTKLRVGEQGGSTVRLSPGAVQWGRVVY